MVSFGAALGGERVRKTRPAHAGITKAAALRAAGLLLWCGPIAVAVLLMAASVLARASAVLGAAF